MLNVYSNFEKRNLLQYGFIVNSGQPNDGKTIADYHTHGLNELNNHMDLQIVLPIEANIAFNIFKDIVKKINEGMFFI